MKKHWSTGIILVVILLLFIPQTSTPIKVFVQRLIAFSPSEIEEENRETLSDYRWELTSLDGTVHNFSASEGKVVVVNIWATWCPPCIAEMPSFQKLYEAYGDRVDFYFVSLESRQTIQRFLDKKGYDLPAYTTKQEFPSVLETGTYPTTYVISKNGAIVMDKKGVADWNSESVRETLNLLLAEQPRP